MKNKNFRKLLNEKYPLQYTKKVGTRNVRWGNRKRPYGDYLWACDRDMFFDIKNRFETNKNFKW